MEAGSSLVLRIRLQVPVVADADDPTLPEGACVLRTSLRHPRTERHIPGGWFSPPMPDRYLKVVTPDDNVATAIRKVDAGETIEVGVGHETRAIEVQEDIPFGHKIAVEDIDDGETVRKYGTSIGNATEDILAGAWVHTHNVESNYGRGDLADENDEAVPASE